MTKGKYLGPYTWIYRWEGLNEFRYEQTPALKRFQDVLLYRPDEKKKYLTNITNNSPHIVVHHNASHSKVKGCMDVDHLHMIR